jgi:hypothetical protein
VEFSSDPLYGDFFKEKDTSAEEKSEQKFCDEVHGVYTLLTISVLVIVNDWVPSDPNAERPDK